MRDSRPSLILFVAAATMAVVARITESDVLNLIFKPIVVPAIFYYYLQTKRTKTNFFFSIALWLFFIADMIMVIFTDYNIVHIMVCVLIGNVIILRFALDDMTGDVSWYTGMILATVLALLGYLLVTILNLPEKSIDNHFFIYLSYGIVLMLIVAAAIFNYLSESTQAFMHLLTAALCMLLSDIFYAINLFMFQKNLPILDNINLIAQFMSYFFLVRYVNSRRTISRNSNIKKAELWK